MRGGDVCLQLSILRIDSTANHPKKLFPHYSIQICHCGIHILMLVEPNAAASNFIICQLFNLQGTF